MNTHELPMDEVVVNENFVTCHNCGEDAEVATTEDSRGKLREYFECERCDLFFIANQRQLAQSAEV